MEHILTMVFPLPNFSQVLWTMEPSNTHFSFSVSLENSHRKVTIMIKVKRQDKRKEVENNRKKTKKNEPMKSHKNT